MNNLETLLGLVYSDGDGSGGGGGGGGTTNYNMLSNRPKYENKVLEGNMTAEELGIATKAELQTKASQADLNTLDEETAASIERITQDLTTKADATELDNFYNKAATNTLLDTKQDALTAGQNITITKDAQTGETTISATGDVSVDWAEITNKPTNLATTEDVNAKVFVAKYGTTTAQEIIAYLEAANEPFAPMLIERGGQYYTVITAAKQNDESVIIRSFATLSGNYYMFTYTVTNGTWANANTGFQPLLVSGTNIKTINGETLLGSGDIQIQAGGTVDQTYDATSTNAQSGTAVAEAIASVPAVTVDDALSETSLNPVQNRVLYGVFESQRQVMEYMQNRIVTLETKLADYEETRLQMTDGTNTVDKVVLTKDAPPLTMFDLAPGAYNASGVKIADFGYESGDVGISTDWDSERGVGTIQSIYRFPAGTAGVVLPSDYPIINPGENFIDENLDWLVIPDAVDTIYFLSGEGVIDTIYYSGTATGSPWGQTSATINTTGTPLAWA